VNLKAEKWLRKTIYLKVSGVSQQVCEDFIRLKYFYIHDVSRMCGNVREILFVKAVLFLGAFAKLQKSDC
jgi:hypothetical protein